MHDAIAYALYGVNTVDNFAKTAFSPVIALNSRHANRLPRGNNENINHRQRRQLDGVLRRKTHKLLSSLAQSVQYSVFEAELNNDQLEQLKEQLRPCLDPEEDKLTIYRLFKANAKIDLAFATDDELLFI